MLLSLLLTGCSTLGSKDAAAGCQVADVASTHYALHHNPSASEQNPIPVPALDVLKLALASYIKWGVSDEDWDNSWIGVRVFIMALGCGAAVSNVRVARERP
jgi:hypothetical protein